MHVLERAAIRRSVPNAAVAKCGPARRPIIEPLGRQRGTIQRGVHDVNLPLVRVGHDDFLSNKPDRRHGCSHHSHPKPEPRQPARTTPLLGGPAGRATVKVRCRGVVVQTSAVHDATPLDHAGCGMRPKPLPSPANWKNCRRGKRNLLRRGRRLIQRPEFDLAIAGAGRQEMAVRREIHRRNRIRMAAQRPGFLPTRCFPETDGRITPHSRQPAAIGRKHRALNEGGIAQFRNQGSVFGAPNLGRRLAARIHQPPPIGRESQNAETVPAHW